MRVRTHTHTHMATATSQRVCEREQCVCVPLFFGGVCVTSGGWHRMGVVMAVGALLVSGVCSIPVFGDLAAEKVSRT